MLNSPTTIPVSLGRLLMPYFSNYATLLILFLSIGLTTHAQEKRLLTSPTLGITTPILDNGLGLHVGVNPSLSLTPHFAIEGQASYLHTRINGSFLSGEKDVSNSVNLLVGGRLYLYPEARSTRLYINVLMGGNYNHTSQNISDFGIGFSSGCFISFSRFLVGLSYDTPQNLILKAGYAF